MRFVGAGHALGLLTALGAFSLIMLLFAAMMPTNAIGGSGHIDSTTQAPLVSYSSAKVPSSFGQHLELAVPDQPDDRVLKETGPVPQPQTATSIQIGCEVEVTGTGDCLNIRDQPSAESSVITCLPDGTRARVIGGPGLSLDYTWWILDRGGWAADQWLRVTAPPEPDVAEYSGMTPSLSGQIAYVGEDGNIWLVSPDGGGGGQVTNDAEGQGAQEVVSYGGPQWSPDGRYLAFLRFQPGGRGDLPAAAGIAIYDLTTGSTMVVNTPAGRNRWGLRWFDRTHLWVIDTRDDFKGCFRETYSGQSIQSFDVVSGEQSTVVHASSDARFINGIGPPSPGGSFMAFDEAAYCEGPENACALDIDTGASICNSYEGAWSSGGWINDHELLLVNTPYGGFGTEPPIAFDVATGNTRPAQANEETDAMGEPGPKGGYLHRKLLNTQTGLEGDVFLNSLAVLHVPIQQTIGLPDQALSPNEDAFVFSLGRRDSTSNAAPGGVWVALADGSQKAWHVTTTGRSPAWQPAEFSAAPPQPQPTAQRAQPASSARDRTRIGPIPLDDKEAWLSFAALPGYTVSHLSNREVQLDGPEFQFFDGEEPIRFWASADVVEDSSSPQQVAQQRVRSYAQRHYLEEGGFGGYDVVVEGALPGYVSSRGAYFVQIETKEEDEVGAFSDLVIAFGLDDLHSLLLTVWHAQYALEDAGKPYLVAGTPYTVLRQANFETLVASATVELSAIAQGASRSEFISSVLAPNEVSKDPNVICSNAFLALFVGLTLAFTSTLFNRTLRENRLVVEGSAAKFFASFPRLSSLFTRHSSEGTGQRPRYQRVLEPLVVLALTGLIYGFLSPDFGLNARSLVLFVSLAIGIGTVTYLYDGGKALVTTSVFKLDAGVKLFAIALLIALGCVLLSRLVDFQPGFLYGFVASYTLLAPKPLDRSQSGRMILYASIALLAVSLVAWFLVIPLRELSQNSDNWWLALPEGAAVAIFVAGLQGSLFNMIPLAFMDGSKMMQWSLWVWLGVFTSAIFLFCWVILKQENSYLDVLPQKRVVTALSVLAFYSLVSVGTWGYFRRRAYGSALPSPVIAGATLLSRAGRPVGLPTRGSWRAPWRRGRK